MYERPYASKRKDHRVDQGTTRYRRDGAVAHVLFNRPQARNAMTWTMYKELTGLCQRVNADGMGDLLWQDTSGNVAIWEMNGTAVLNQNSSFVATVPGQWSIKGTGDFNGDGMTDILWQDSSGNVAIWEMNGTTISNSNSSFVGTVRAHGRLPRPAISTARATYSGATATPPSGS
jgi:hypothetical protein